MTIVSIILLAGSALNVIMILFLLFFEDSNSLNRFTWILLLSFMPIVGVVAYFLFSGKLFTRTKKMLQATQRASDHFSLKLETQEKNLDALMSNFKTDTKDSYGSLIRMNMRYGKSPLTTGNCVNILKDGEDKFQALFHEIEQAKKTIHLSYFIINNDETGRSLIKILSQKAHQGVKIRFLYDHVGSFFLSSQFFKPLVKAGGKVSKFFPVSLINPFSINYRNHRKLVIIDSVIGYFGGMNVGDEYANRNNARPYYWRDTQVRITGPAVRMLQTQFLIDWYTSTSEEASLFEKMPVSSLLGKDFEQELEAPPCITSLDSCSNVATQIVSSGPDDKQNDEIRDAMIHMILKAKESVYIESPYFTPDESFKMALKIAALSGIDVQIIVPGTWDKWYVKFAAMPFINELMSYGVKFWFYNGFIHSKMLVVDRNLATIGSTNMDTRSFSLHFELNAFFYSLEFSELCSKMFDEDRANSQPVPIDFYTRASPIKKGIWNFFKLFSPLM